MTSIDSQAPEVISEKTVLPLFNIAPGTEPSFGGYTVAYTPPDGHEIDDLIVFSSQGATLLISFAAFVIARAAAPTLKPHHLYDLVYHMQGPRDDKRIIPFTPDLGVGEYDDPQVYKLADTSYGPIEGINYGPIAQSVMQCVNRFEVAEPDVITQVLNNDDLSLEQKRRELWLGKGNLWNFVAPNRFPIAETLASPPLTPFPITEPLAKVTPGERPNLSNLPDDLLQEIAIVSHPRTLFVLLQINRSIRAALLPRIHNIAFKLISEITPHLFPADPFKFDHEPNRGREELDYWTTEWAKGGFHLSGTVNDVDNWRGSPDAHRIPWLLYAREATKSPSMKNRKRIWGCALQFERLYPDFLKRKMDPDLCPWANIVPSE